MVEAFKTNYFSKSSYLRHREFVKKYNFNDKEESNTTGRYGKVYYIFNKNFMQDLTPKIGRQSTVLPIQYEMVGDVCENIETSLEAQLVSMPLGD